MSASKNSDGSSSASFKTPIIEGDANVLSVIGSHHVDRNQKTIEKGVGFALDNINGHSLILSHSETPKMDRNTAAANVNLFTHGEHNVEANAFAARTMPQAAQIPNFNTFGGGVDYTFKEKHGVGVSVTHTPLFKQTDYAAMGKINLASGNNSSLDFNAGLSKSVSPFHPKTSWERKGVFSFTKQF